METLKGVAVGVGYFSHFQYDAWNRTPGVRLTAICNRSISTGIEIAAKYGIEKHYTDYREMIDVEKPDFVDIITPPETHFEMCAYAADAGVNIICQKPLAPSYSQAVDIVEYVQKRGVQFMVHENWRFQPWYREIKKLLEAGTIGRVHYMYFRSRMGDGWGKDAYIPRQPYFREYPRLLVYENGIHFIDTFRYLNGEISEVFARLRRLNPVIKGEDFGLITFGFANGSDAVLDANRYNEPDYQNPRYTFGIMLIEGEEGSIRLAHDGQITVQRLGEQLTRHVYSPSTHGFCGDCVYVTQQHFVDCLRSGTPFETNGDDYLRSLAVQEAVYRSADLGEVVRL